MGKLVVGNVPQGFEKANDWYLVTIEGVTRLKSKDHKPMVKVDYRINDALTQAGYNYIGQSHPQWYVVNDEVMEEGAKFEDIDWDPHLFGVQRLIKVYLCIPHTDTDDTEEILNALRNQQLWIRLHGRDGKSNITDAKNLDQAPAGFQGTSEIAAELEELPF